MDETLYDNIKGIAYSLCDNDDTYMDLAHDACVKVMTTKDDWDGKCSYKTWASIVAAHCIIDTLRREGKRAEFEGWAASVHDKPPLSKEDTGEVRSV